MPAIDLTPATRRLTAVVAAVRDDQLSGPTPCTEYTVGDLLDHIAGFASGFAWAAAKTAPPGEGRGPSGDAAHLDPRWRTAIPVRLAALADAWRAPGAWEGTTEAAGVPLSGETAGLFALDEVVMHGWDLARAIGVELDVEPAHLDALRGLIEPLADPASRPPGLFGPVVPVAADGTPFERLLRLTGRDPAWAPAPR